VREVLGRCRERSPTGWTFAATGSRARKAKSMTTRQRDGHVFTSLCVPLKAYLARKKVSRHTLGTLERPQRTVEEWFASFFKVETRTGKRQEAKTGNHTRLGSKPRTKSTIKIPTNFDLLVSTHKVELGDCGIALFGVVVPPDRTF